MARHVEGPWFRTAKNTWYTTIRGKMVSLKVKGKANRKEAVTAWHRLMAAILTPAPETEALPAPEPLTVSAPVPIPVPSPPAPAPLPTDTQPELTVASLVNLYLDTKQGVVKHQTMVVYGCLAQRITRAFGSRAASGLKGEEATRWLLSLPVGTNTKYDIGGLLLSVFKWAKEEGLLSTNPMKKFKRPARQSRGKRAIMGPCDHERLMAVAHPALRTLIILLRETGARPCEIAKLEAQHVDFASGTAILSDHKTAQSTGKPRYVMLTPTALEVLKPLAEKRPTGPLLLNGKSKRWKKDAISLAFRRVSEEAGVKVLAYNYRHQYATDALTAGVPDATVAALLGHATTTMLFKHYSHLTSKTRVLREALCVFRPQKENPPSPQ